MATTQHFDALDALQACEKPFLFEEHGFIMKDGKNGKQEIDSVYIRKDALRRRLTMIDHRWQTMPPELMSIEGNVITMRGSMIFLGTTRTGIGTGIIQTTKYDRTSKSKIPIEGYELDRQIAKTMKTANTDLLPRLCIEWNIGSYLRPVPKTIVTADDFRTWLESKVKEWEHIYTAQRHWAANGKGTLFNAMVKEYGLSWNTVRAQLEPGRVLNSLRDITLTDVQAFARLADLRTALRPVGGL